MVVNENLIGLFFVSKNKTKQKITEFSLKEKCSFYYRWFMRVGGITSRSLQNFSTR